MLIHGARVLLTGASGGIGAALTAQLLARGARLIISGRDHDAMTVEPVGEQAARVAVADLADEDDVRRLARSVGDVDILINNAGVGWYGDTAAMPCSDVRGLVDVNLLAPLILTRLLLPGMLERSRGSIVFTSSIAGRLGVEREAVYSATKAALSTYAEALRSEVGPRGIEITVVSLGAVDTEYFRRRGAEYQRRWPAPLRPDVVATSVIAAIERNQREMFAPRWLRIPTVLHDKMPALYRGLANKFG